MSCQSTKKLLLLTWDYFKLFHVKQQNFLSMIFNLKKKPILLHRGSCYSSIAQLWNLIRSNRNKVHGSRKLLYCIYFPYISNSVGFHWSTFFMKNYFIGKRFPIFKTISLKLKIIEKLTEFICWQKLGNVLSFLHEKSGWKSKGVFQKMALIIHSKDSF